jgi:hypothetical protein
MWPSRSIQRPLNLTWLAGLWATLVGAVDVLRFPRCVLPRRLPLYLVHGPPPPAVLGPLLLASSGVFAARSEQLLALSIAVLCESFYCNCVESTKQHSLAFVLLKQRNLLVACMRDFKVFTVNQTITIE